MWQRYGKDDQIEKAVQLALREGQTNSKILEMLKESRQYQSCLDQYGPKNAQQLAELALKAAIRKEQQLKQQQQQHLPKPKPKQKRGFDLSL